MHMLLPSLSRHCPESVRSGQADSAADTTADSQITVVATHFDMAQQLPIQNLMLLLRLTSLPLLTSPATTSFLAP
jgi:hypothetical protein